MCDAALLSSLCCFLTCYYSAVACDMYTGKCSCACSCTGGRRTAPSIESMDPPPAIPPSPVQKPKNAWVIIEAADGTPMVGIASPLPESEESA